MNIELRLNLRRYYVTVAWKNWEKL